MVKQKLKFLIAIIVLGLLFQKVLPAQEKSLTVVPLPKEYKFLEGSISLSGGISLKKFIEDHESISLVLNEIEEVHSAIYGKSLFSSNSVSELIIGIPSKNKSFKKLCESI